MRSTASLIEPLENRYAPAALIIGDISKAEGTGATPAHADFVVTLDAAATNAVTVDYATVFGTATAGTDFVSKTGKLTFEPGETSKTISIDIIGDSIDEDDEQFTIQFTNPTGASMANTSGTVTITDDDPVLSISPATVTEVDGASTSQAVFTLTLSQPATRQITLHVATADGTATSGTATGDYTPITDQIVTFMPGDTTITVPVTVLADNDDEGPETFRLVLSQPTNITLPATPSATATITDDDQRILTISSPTVTEAGGTDPTEAQFILTLNEAATRIITLQVNTTGSSATDDVDAIAGTDYESIVNQTVTFMPGEMTKTVTVKILGDTTDEENEAFQLQVTGTGVTLPSPAFGKATIVDSDLPPTLMLTGFNILEGDSGTKTAVYTLTLSSASAKTVKVNAFTNGGTAIAGVDYALFENREVTFAPGQTVQTVSVSIINGDFIEEVDKTIILNVNNGVNVTLEPTTQTVTGTIVDDDVAIIVSDAQGLEGAPGTPGRANFLVSLSAPVSHTVTVYYYAQSNTAIAGTDFAAAGSIGSPIALTFEPDGPMSQVVPVNFIGDTVGERTEDFFLKLVNSSGARIADGEGLGTITNDDTSVSISDARVVEGGPGTDTIMRFTVTLDRPAAGGAVTVNYKTEDGDATSIVSNPDTRDFIAIPAGTVTFDAGAAGVFTQIIEVHVRGDNTSDAAAEKFNVKITGISGTDIGAGNLVDDTGVGTIVEDESPVITIADAQIAEGDAGNVTMIFAINLSSAATSDVVVSYQTLDGTATSSGLLPDFVPLTSSVTIPAGSSQALVTVQINGDLVKEGNQNFLVRLTGVTSGTANILDDEAVGTIIDNDTTDPVVSLTGGSIAEGDTGTAHLLFFANLSKPSEVPVTVTFTTMDGTATSPADYIGHDPITLTFPAGVTSMPVSVLVKGDTLGEGNHAFTGTLSAPVGATLGTASATGTIIDDDIFLSIADASFAEGTTGKLTVSLKDAAGNSISVPNGSTVTVNFSVSAVTATLNTDFRPSTTGTSLTFNPGESSKDISFDLLEDTIDEANETFTVTLSSPTGAKLGSATLGTGTIIDNDPGPAISITNGAATEGDSSAAQMSFTISLSKISAQEITVDASTAAGTAFPNSDFTALSNLQVKFAPGETSKTITVAITGDTTDELTESFTVNLSNPGGGATISTGTATGTITDNDLRALSITDAVVVEGNVDTKTVTFTVSLPTPAALAVTVNYMTFDGAAPGTAATAGTDYVATSGMLTFAPGETTKTITVTINADSVAEPDEFFLVRLTDAGNATIADNEGSGRIQDNDTAYRLTVSSASVAEDGPGSNPNTVTFTVTRPAVGVAGTVTYTTVDGTAGSGATRPDYIGASGTLNFGPNETSKTVTITINGDQNFENNETFKLRLTGSTGGVLVDDAGTTQATLEKEVTILAGNDARPTMSITNVSANEGTLTNEGLTNFNFIVRLSAANERETGSVAYQSADGTAISLAMANFLADYNETHGTLSFAPGEVEKTITVKVKGDSIDEADTETFVLNLSGATFSDGTTNTPITLTSAQGVGAILDDDAAPTVSFESASLPVNEGNAGVTTQIVKIKLSGASERPITVALNQEVTGATNPEDYTTTLPATLPTTFTFAPGDTEKTFEVRVVGDTLDEGAGSLKFTLSAPTNATLGGVVSSTVSITDDDPQPVLAINSLSIVEGNTGTSQLLFTVTLTGASESTISVNFATVDGTAKSLGVLSDFTATTGMLSFAPGETTKTIAVTIVGDTFVEANETFTLKLSGATNATIAQDTGTGTIVQDGDVNAGISISDVRIVEDDSRNSTMTFQVEMAGVSGTDVIFHAATRNGTAVAGIDYGAVSRDFTIAAGQTTATINVTIGGDTVFEPTESFFLNLSNPSSASNLVFADSEARGSILNNDIQIVNARTVRYIDEDGDLATVQISKGTLLNRFGSIDTNVLRFTSAGTVGGRTLSEINLTGSLTHAAIYNGLDLKVTAEPQPGALAAGVVSDGQVDVGYIHANDPDLEFTNGIDMHDIIVEGDVTRIAVGDVQITPSITGVVRVGSLGVPVGNQTDTQSFFLSGVNSLVVRGDVLGFVRVFGGNLGDINNLRIEGALKGGAGSNSGRIDFSGTLLNATIGSILGSTGVNSGLLSGALGTSAANPEGSSIGTLRVVHEVVGGAGENSGGLLVPSAGTVVIGTKAEPGRVAGGSGAASGILYATGRFGTISIQGDLVGGGGEDSGEIFAGAEVGQSIGTVRISGSMAGGAGGDSGSIIANGAMGSAAIRGNVVGGAGDRSATIQVSRALGSVTLGVDETATGGTASDLDGNLTGGAGASSGLIAVSGKIGSVTIHGDIKGSTGSQSGGIQNSRDLNNLDLRGSLIGGDSNSSSDPDGTLKSGFISARSIGQAVIGGDITAGIRGSTPLFDSGSIRVANDIASLVIKGKVEGSTTNPVIIAAGGLGTDDPLTPENEAGAAITKLVINGSATKLNILGGYTGAATSDDPLGNSTNADAQIGTVTFKGAVQGVNVVSGVVAGTDGRFGTADDAAIAGGSASLISRIAKVVFQGTISSNTEIFGVSAQSVKAAIIGTTSLPLLPGAGNDDREIGATGSKMRLHEVAVA